MSGIVESLDTEAALSDSLAARVRRLIESECGAGSHVANLGTMEDGHAGLTFGFDVFGISGQSLGSYVLKLAPVGVTRRGNTDVYRQAPLLRALSAAGMPVPAVPWASPDEEHWARPTSSWSACPGGCFWYGSRTAHFRATQTSCVKYGFRPRECWPGCIGSIGKALLPDWEKPRPLRAELDFWTPLLRHAPDPQWLAVGTELRSLLAADIPDGQPIGVVHGDFQPGNILYVDGRAETLIDWELASIGSQGLDLGWLLMMSDGEAWDPGWRPVAPVSRDDLVNAYREAGGTALFDIDWYQALAHFRGCAIACLNVKLHRSGKRKDDLWERFATSVPTLFARGIELARRAADE